MSEARAGLASGINNAASRVAMLVVVACVGILSGNAFATGLPIVSRAAALVSLLGAVTALVLVRGGVSDAGQSAHRAA